MKRYLTIYLHLLNFSIKSLLSYRANLLLLLGYGPVYFAILYCIVLLAFHNSPLLFGWTKPEGLLLFSIFQLIYSTCLIVFMNGFRQFLWQGIRLGDLDFILTKPVAPQFLVGFSRPDFELIIVWMWMLYLSIKNISAVIGSISLVRILIFIFLFFLSHILIYLTISTYATLGFFIIKAQQIFELFDKMADFSQYPTGILPTSLQITFHTILPIAFFGYVPTGILLGKLSIWWGGLMIGLTIIFWGINRVLWQYGLRHYSSASS